jgi:hypothetical protein
LRSLNKKSLVIFASIVILVAFAVGGTYAYLSAASKPLTNTFTVPGGSTPTVNESFNGTSKSRVSVSVSGTVDSYVRVKLVVSLVDASGNTVAISPVEGTDYTVSYNSTDWTKIGDYYYYNSIIQNGTTEVLFNSITTKNNNYHLVVDVMAQTIQAGGGAVGEAWGMSYNGTWSEVVTNE